MAFGAEVAPLIAALTLKDSFSGPLKKAGGALSAFDAKLDNTQSRAFRAGQQIGTGIQNSVKLAVVGLGLLTTQVAAGLNSLIKLESQTAQTEAVLKSTGSSAGVTAGMVRKLAEQFESLNATVGDETIQNAENLLLTFTNIREKAFEPTLKAALDMNQALGGGEDGLAANIKLLGKALQDPEKGLSRLGRAVGGFSDETTAAVKAALKQNDTLKAQTIILTELERRYGGSFARAGETTRGKVAKFTDSIEDLQRALADALLPTLGNVADALSKTLADPKVITGVTEFGKQLAGLLSPENLATGGAILQEVFATAKAAAPSIAAAAQIMGKVVSTAVGIFRSLPPEIQQLAIGAFAVNKLTGGLVTNIAGGLISSVLKQLVSGVVNVSGAVVNVAGGPGLIGDVKGGKSGGGGLGVLPAVGIAGIVLALATPIGEAFAAALPPELKGPGGRGESESQRRTREGREEMLRQIQARPAQFGGQSLEDRDALRSIANLKIPPPVTNVKVEVNVTAAAVTKAITIQKRFGPPGGSRNHAVGTGPLP